MPIRSHPTSIFLPYPNLTANIRPLCPLRAPILFSTLTQIMCNQHHPCLLSMTRAVRVDDVEYRSCSVALLYDGHAITFKKPGSCDSLILNARCQTPSGRLKIVKNRSVFEIVFKRSIYMHCSVDR